MDYDTQKTRLKWILNFLISREVRWHPKSNIPQDYWVVFAYLGRALSLCSCTGSPQRPLSSALSWSASFRAHQCWANACVIRQTPWRYVVDQELYCSGPYYTTAWHETSWLFTPYKRFVLTTKICFALNAPAWSTDAHHCTPCLSLCPRDVRPRGANTAWVQVTCQSNKLPPWFVSPWPLCWGARQGAKFKAASNDLPRCCWRLK